jgi:Na+/H+ antiporter NhaC
MSRIATGRTTALCISILVVVAVVAAAQMNSTPSPSSAPTSAVASVGPAARYGLWSLAPALVAIFLAITTRQVILALALGILTASGMLACLNGIYNPITFVTQAMDRYLLGVLAHTKKDGTGVDLEHITILLYTFFMGAMIGVLTASGGTRALVARVTRRVDSRRSGQFSAYIAGLLIFFDDYASAMIVGPGVRPIFDRLKISREKLAYLVNITAAPVSSIFLGTWLAVQIGWIDGGLDAIGSQPPEFLKNASAGTMFWSTIPYRTYTLLALAMAALVALTGRDFGPMKRCESRALAHTEDALPGEQSDPTLRRAYLAVVPAGLLIAMTVGLMFKTGHEACTLAGVPISWSGGQQIIDSLREILGKSDSHYALLYASLSAAALSIVLTVGSRALSLAKTMEAAVSGMSAMFAATIILVLAWGLSRASTDLELGRAVEVFLHAKIESGAFSVQWLAPAIFIAAAIISFSTGTSWGTMAILLPPVVSIAAGLFAPMPAGQALTMFYAVVGSAMAGAVFGNTCSPLADVAVLSATFSQCDLAAHIRTALPYALVVALVGLLSTTGMDYALVRWAPAFHTAYWNVWMSLATGVVILFLILSIVGRPARPFKDEPPTAMNA